MPVNGTVELDYFVSGKSIRYHLTLLALSGRAPRGRRNRRPVMRRCAVTMATSIFYSHVVIARVLVQLEIQGL